MLQRVREFQLTPIAPIGLALHELYVWGLQSGHATHVSLKDRLYMLDWFVAPVKSPGRNILDYANYVFAETQLNRIAAPPAIPVGRDIEDDATTWRTVHYVSDHWSPCHFIVVKPDTTACMFVMHFEHRLSLHPVLDRDTYESELKFAALQFLSALDYEALCLLYKNIGLKCPSLSQWQANNWSAPDKIVDYVKRMFL